jgi:hypothetical protein
LREKINAMSKKVLCHNCREKFPKEELIQVTKSRRLCVKCDKKVTKEAEEYKNLIDCICSGFNIKAPTGQQLKSIKQFKELGYSYYEIQYTLYYIYGILRKKPEGTSLGLVPFYYEKAKEHYRLVENAKNSAKSMVIEERNVERIVKEYKINIHKTRLINIEEII